MGDLDMKVSRGNVLRRGYVSFDYVKPIQVNARGNPIADGSPYTLSQQVELLEAGADVYGTYASGRSTEQFMRRSAEILRHRIAAGQR